MRSARARLLVISASGASLAALSSPAQAQELASAVDEIVVTATRTEKRVDEIPATVSVVTAEEIEEQLATDVKDLVRFEPGVSVRSSPARFGAASGSTGRDGNSGFNIRGLEGNRVLMTIDGVRVPDAFSFGAQAVGRGDYADLDLLKSVEVLRGPASALYGSDGVAGAVSFTTKDPIDLLESSDTLVARGRVAYASADDSWAKSGALAGRAGDWSALLAYSRRDGHEQETQGSKRSLDASRTAANPQDIDSNAVLAKLVFAPSDAHRFRLTLDHFDRTVMSEVFSARSLPPLTATSAIDLDARDTTRRDRVTFDHRYVGGGFINAARWAIYWQDSETVEFTAEDRNTAADRARRNTFDTRVWGGDAQAESTFALGGATHRLTYGGDFSETRQEGVRDGTVPPAGERFPTRAFPTTDFRLMGLFLQDEIALLAGRLTLFPALRFDRYELAPKPDPLFTGLTAPSDGQRLSPKLGIVWQAAKRLGFFASFAEGFRAPSPSQVNNGFTNVVFGYVAIPNPDLHPETSRTFEGGVRLREIDLAGGRWSASVTGFTGRYRNFIDQIALTSPLPAACGRFRLCFQFVNFGRVQISGVEGRIDTRWDNGFGLLAALSYTRGEQATDGTIRPLDSIDPFKIVAGLSYRDPAGRFGGQLIATHSARKGADRVGQGCAPDFLPVSCYRPGAFTTIDATAWVGLAPWATLRAGLFNITDETYAWWSDVRGLSRTSPVLDAYTQPGRNLSVSLTARF